MATTTLNINVNIPHFKQVDVDSLRKKVTLYAQILVDKTPSKAARREPLSKLRGVLKTSSTDVELLDDYATSKYGL